jgi:hypothetical protein
MLSRETGKSSVKISTVFIFKDPLQIEKRLVHTEDFVLFPLFPVGGDRQFAFSEPVPLREGPISKQAGIQKVLSARIFIKSQVKGFGT